VIHFLDVVLDVLVFLQVDSWQRHRQILGECANIFVISALTHNIGIVYTEISPKGRLHISPEGHRYRNSILIRVAPCVSDLGISYSLESFLPTLLTLV